MPSGAGALARLGVHPLLEVCEALLGDLLVASREIAGVLLQSVEEDEQVAGALVKNAIPGIPEPNPELAQAAVDLRGDGELSRRRVCMAAVEVLLHELVDLCHGGGLRCKHRLEPVIDRLTALRIAVIHGLGSPSMAEARDDLICLPRRIPPRQLLGHTVSINRARATEQDTVVPALCQL
jgi:hypothetical protein